MDLRARAAETLDRLRFYGSVVRGLVRAGSRRAVHGGRHPDWPLPYELAMTALRVAAHDHHELATSLARAQVAPLPRSLHGKVRVGTAELAGIAVDIHTPAGWSARRPTLLYLHGGGYVTCSPASHRDVIARIAHVTGMRCIAPDYRLAPAHPFPAALDDALAVYRLLLDGLAPARPFVAGDSAGGGLALALMLSLRAAGEPLPPAAVLLSPWVDLTLGVDVLHAAGPHDYVAARRLVDNARAYAGESDLANPLISPAHAELTGLPPLLVQTGAWEILCEQNQAFTARARAAGVDVTHEVEPGMLHAFTCFAGISPQGTNALASIGRFLARHAAHPRAPEAHAP
ncbi:MAG: alpha/beta hydrolase [Polyangiales bacterium]